MPRIQEYQSQVRTAGPSDMPDVRAPRGIGGGLEALGAGVSRAAEGIQRYENQKADYEAQKALAESQNYWLKRFQDAKDNSDQYLDAEGKPNFVQKFQEEYSTWKESQISNRPSANAQVLELGFTRMEGSLLQDAHGIDAGIYAKQQRRFATDNLETSKNLVRANPAKLSDVIASQTAVLSSAPWIKSDEERKNLVEAANREVYGSAMDGRVSGLASSMNATPESADRMLAEFKNPKNKWAENAGSSAYDSALSRLENIKRHLSSERSQFYAEDFKEKMAQLESKGTYFGEEKGMYTPQWITNNIPAGPRREQMLQLEKVARAQGTASQQIKGKTVFEMSSELRAEEAALAKTPEFSRDDAGYRAKLAAVNRAVNMLKSDPATYAMETSTVAAEHRAIYEKNPSPENASLYADKVTSEQKRLDPTMTPSILTKQDAAAIKNTLASIGNSPDGVEKAHSFLSQEIQKWGPKHWPTVVNDLRKEKALNDTQFVVASLIQDSNNIGITKELLRSSTVKAQELKNQIPNFNDEQDTIKANVASALADFNRTLVGAVADDKSDTSNAYFNAMTDFLLYQKANPGINTYDADALAGELFKEYEFVDTMRIPKAEHPEEVVSGTTPALLSLSTKDIVVSSNNKAVDPKAAKSAYLNRVRANGKFVTSGSQKGLRLIDEAGAPVYERINGEEKPVEYTWAELRALSIDPTFNPKLQERVDF